VARQPVCRQAPALGTNAYRDRGGVVLCAESDSCWDWRDPAPVCNDVLTNSMRCCYRTLPRTQRAQKPRTSPGHARPSSTAIDCLPVNTRIAPSTHAGTRRQRLPQERAAACARRVIHDNLRPASSDNTHTTASRPQQHQHTLQPVGATAVHTPSRQRASCAVSTSAALQGQHKPQPSSLHPFRFAARSPPRQRATRGRGQQLSPASTSAPDIPLSCLAVAHPVTVGHPSAAGEQRVKVSALCSRREPCMRLVTG
jgi:hypothetical protein